MIAMENLENFNDIFLALQKAGNVPVSVQIERFSMTIGQANDRPKLGRSLACPEYAGSNATQHLPCIANIHSFWSTFLFSVETEATIGYGYR